MQSGSSMGKLFTLSRESSHAGATFLKNRRKAAFRADQIIKNAESTEVGENVKDEGRKNWQLVHAAHTADAGIYAIPSPNQPVPKNHHSRKGSDGEQHKMAN